MKKPLNPSKKALIAFFFLILILFFGTWGFMKIEKWSFEDSFFMTIITISTVGFGLVEPLSLEGKYFTVILIFASLIIIGYAVTTLVSFIFEGLFMESLKERQMKKILKGMKDHYIICGFGDIGHAVVDELASKKVSFVVIDKLVDAKDIERYHKSGFIEGDASEEEVLSAAGIEKARGLICCLPDDRHSVFVVLTARQMNSQLHIVSQVSEKKTESKLLKAGANRVISPSDIAGKRLATVSVNPSVVNFLEILNSNGGENQFKVELISIQEGSFLVGKTLQDSNLRQKTGVSVLGILTSEGKPLIGSLEGVSLATYPLKEGLSLVAMGKENQIESLRLLC